MTHKYNKGSEWRKWDLHFHTPSSYDYKDNSVTNQQIVDTLIANEISVVAITDHHIIDVARIKDLQCLAGDNITILPGIECCSELGGSESIHFIGIFSEDADIDSIWTKIQGKHNLTPSDVTTKGAEKIICRFEETCKTIKELGGIITVHAGTKTNSIESIKNNLLVKQEQKQGLLSEFISVLEVGKVADIDRYKTRVFPSIGFELPTILCSDNHDIKTYSLKENCWFKADPTFYGLNQIFNEPSERVFIGDKPEIFDKIKYNKTKFIKNLTVKPIDGYTGQHGDWFDFELDLNPGLVAIIGNKGSGKSAIADMIALCSHINNQKDFSFLRVDKFRGKGKPASSFKSKLTFIDGTSIEKNLEDSSESDTNKLIKYLPQGYFETICNELSKAEQFQKEIENVVFQYIEGADRLGKLDFSSLIYAKTASINSDTELYKKDISILVDELIKLEKKENIKYKQSLINKVAALTKEIEALEMPDIVEDPNKDETFAETNKAITESISVLTQEIESTKSRLERCRQEKANTNIEIQDLQNINSLINQVVSNFEQVKSDNDLLKYGLNWNEVVKLEFNESLITSQITPKLQQIRSIDILLGNIESETQKSLTKELNEKQKELEHKQTELSGPQKLYHDYLSKLNTYNSRIKEIRGDSTTSSLENIFGINTEIDYIDNKLVGEISNILDRIIAKVEKIHQLKRDVISIYEQVKHKIDSKIEKNKDILDGISIEINASLTKSVGFENKLLYFIDKSVKGSFYGAVDSQLRLVY